VSVAGSSPGKSQKPKFSNPEILIKNNEQIINVLIIIWGALLAGECFFTVYRVKHWKDPPAAKH
jgi:hypothetical protein